MTEPQAAADTLFDVGAQAERTALEWHRTGVGLVASGALAVRWSVIQNFPVWPGVALAVVGAVASMVLVRRRYRRVLETVRAGRTPLSRYLIPGTAAFVVAVVLAMGVGVGVEMSRL